MALPVKDDTDLKSIGVWFPKEIGLKYGNLFEMTEEELTGILRGYEAMVYAVGPDDRVVPKAPAYQFFYDRLVTACGRAFSAAKKAGIKKAVLLSSYFCYFDRRYPERKLSQNHTYIRVRNEQAEEMIRIGGKEMAVVILELPYIFGRMPERMPLWKEVFLDRFEKLPAIFFPKGGTTMIHVTGIAEAVVAATFNGMGGVRYPIGNKNVKYKAMLQIMNDVSGNRKKVINVPTWVATIGGALVDKNMRKKVVKAVLTIENLCTISKAKIIITMLNPYGNNLDTRNSVTTAVSALSKVSPIQSERATPNVLTKTAI